MNIELNMNLAHRMLIDGERKYIMFRTSNNAKKKLLKKYVGRTVRLREG